MTALLTKFFSGKGTDANDETYSGDKWYLKSEIPTTYFKPQRDVDLANMEEAIAFENDPA
jgi:hypothetical protein